MTTINTDQQGGAPLALPISQAVRLIWPGLSGKCGPAVRRKRLFATHILTNEYHNNGAVGMMRFDLLESFAVQKECNLYILPSSLNEVILIPDRGDRTPDFLRSLVKKNNKDYPEEGDLSENIYYYRRGKKQLEVIL